MTFGGRWVHTLALSAILALGLGVRLFDLTDPPLDFHETRQLRSALIARGMYYQMWPEAPAERRAAAVAAMQTQEAYEPPIQERLVALTYLAIGGERLWIARIYTSLFWVLGGVALYALGRRWTSAAGGLASMAFYLSLPYAVTASRSFQPDPLMVALILGSALALSRWGERPGWTTAAFTGLVSGLAVLVKAYAALPIIGGLAGVSLGALGLRRSLSEGKAWLVAALAIGPALLYHWLAVPGQAASLVSFWELSFAGLLGESSFYSRWFRQILAILGYGSLVFSLLGVTLLRTRSDRGLALGLWAGYLAFGLLIPYRVMTHDYYHLMLVGIVALCLAPVAEGIWAVIHRQSAVWRLSGIALLSVALLNQFRYAALPLAAEDHHLEAAGWRRLGEALPSDGPILALTQAYGTRLCYYGWVCTTHWPYTEDMDLWALSGGQAFQFEAEFMARTEGMHYFLVTDFGALDSQPALKDLLYGRYAVAQEGDGYVLFDLTAPSSGAD